VRVVDTSRVLLDVLFPPTCIGCGLLRPTESLCSACSLEAGELSQRVDAQGIHAEVPYDGPWGRALHRFKYHGDLALAGPLGRRLAMAPVLAEDWDVVVPVPLHWLRRFSRGFHPVVAMLGVAARRDPRLRARLERTVLRRPRGGPPQATLAFEARQKALEGAFTVDPRRQPTCVVGRRVLVVDDVVTTGATLREARRALLHAGALATGALALMRAL